MPLYYLPPSPASVFFFQQIPIKYRPFKPHRGMNISVFEPHQHNHGQSHSHKLKSSKDTLTRLYNSLLAPAAIFGRFLPSGQGIMLSPSGYQSVSLTSGIPTANIAHLLQPAGSHSHLQRRNDRTKHKKTNKTRAKCMRIIKQLQGGASKKETHNPEFIMHYFGNLSSSCQA